MVVINKIIRVIDWINEKISKAVSFLVFALILTLTYEVIARYFFGSPTQWSLNLTYFICSFFLILTMGYTWQCGEHVGVDLLSSKLPRRVGALLNVIFILGLFFLTWTNIGRVMYNDMLRSWALQERSTIGAMPPVYPYKTWIFAGVALLLLQGVSQLLKEIQVMLGRDRQS
ncbi:TRAP-type mannitol/chloroaromatic compound transport system permease small subunit [Desulfosalsimonas propionicica]|uniref:TRAP-type mannitol/chloroaromatic compound transport system permease small subunit n=1 Tax=Desulfosalsimonas propionicica TaxID=332175 RepID=A0A7W0C749_9BACT|nr:TRAP transporter small permease subunit [Desulfosalsimonas propionicica]MBA2880362.1 TRAP-type mannitol/chloroaromatic compound transport system permease small subunit [Desulfosalsimonas propionicica]